MRYLFFIIFFVTLLLRLLPASLNNMPFTMDQGRDLIDVRQIWQGADLRLIGPTTSLNGLYLGPFYYYLISIPHLLTSGNPQAILVWQILFFHLAVIYFWKTFKNQSPAFANFASILLLLSPISFYVNRYFWNANFMPSFTLIYLTILVNITSSVNAPKKDYLLGLVVGLSLQVEAAFAILFLPFSILFYLATKSTLPRYARFFTSFFVTMIPQILFELAKGFPMTKVVIAEITGNTNTLGEKLNLTECIAQRIQSYTTAFHQSSHIGPNILFCLAIGCLLVFILYKNKAKQKAAYLTAAITFSFIIFSVIFYLSYSSFLKSWYTFSLSLVFSLFIGSCLSLLDPSKIGYKLVSTLVVIMSLIAVYKSQIEYLKGPIIKNPNNPSAYQNQLKVIDDVYKLADGGPFFVYNFIPSVYDYPFQYLFWSHGLKKYGYSPNDLAYLPNQPEYIKNKNSYLQNTKEITSDTPTILIIQAGDNKTQLQEWMGNFAKLCEMNKLEYSFGQKVLYLKPCSTN